MATILWPAFAASSRTNRTSLILIPASPSSAARSWSTRALALLVAPPVGNARTNRARLAWVQVDANWMLAIPALDSRRAKLRSAAADSSGTPSM